jgi:signal transduction histidine kinase
MTEELSSKRELSTLNSTLENRVLERSSELALANKELLATLQALKQTQSELIATEKMASLGSLVAGVAHELNTPIGNSLLASTTLLDRINEFEHDMTKGMVLRSKLVLYLHEISQGCELIARSLHRAANLINSFKQVAVDQTSDQRRVFDLGQVLQDNLSAFAPRLRLANCTTTLDVQGNFALDSYPGSVGQIISNLLNNALIHAFEGRDSGDIQICVRKLGEAWVEIDLSDNGVGMSDHVLHHVFDPFFTTKMGKGGSGLGMNIVYNMVLGILGGRIDIQTAIGKGTSVKILLPFIAPTRERAPTIDIV